MKIYSSKEKMEILANALNELEMCSDIRRRYGKEYDFLVYQDTEKDWEKIMSFIIKENPGIEQVWKHESAINPYPLTFIDWITDEHYGNSDEYSICEDCGQAVHNDYGYYKEYTVFEAEFEGAIALCDNCLHEEEGRFQEYLKYYINNSDRCIDMFTNEEMKAKGWVIEGQYRNGDPKIFLEEAQQRLPNKDFVFVRTDEDMFNIEYVLMSKDKQKEEEE